MPPYGSEKHPHNSPVVQPPAKKCKMIETKRKKCNKWKLCGISEAYDYYDTYTKYCRRCDQSSRTLFLVHDALGDYMCYDCEEPVYTQFFCIKCKGKMS
jgi:hypothetical protein